MALSTVITLLLVATGAIAVPTKTVEQRAPAKHCGMWDSVPTASFTVYGNQWGISTNPRPNGWQCFWVDWAGGNTIGWRTDWSWTGGPQYQVKTYANAGLHMKPKVVSTIRSIPTKWQWSYTGNNLVADVSYDLFLSATPSGYQDYEIMVWLGAFGGAGPLSNMSPNGAPVAKPRLGGITWHLYKGKIITDKGSWIVYSFVALGNQSNFSGNLMEFINFLTSKEGVSKRQYLQSIAAGTEPFSGVNAAFTTHDYSVSIQ